MRTAEEILKEHGVLNVYDSVNCSKYDIIHLMNVYAKHVAKEALKNAKEKVEYEYQDYDEQIDYDFITDESNIPKL